MRPSIKKEDRIMQHAIRLYGVGGTRSARCRWVLYELGLDFEYIDRDGLIGSDELRTFHPQAKSPAAVIDGLVLFESSAICNYLCDMVADNKLLAPSGTPARGRHEQWVSFAQSEIEGWLWSNFKHRTLYPEKRRVPAVIEQNYKEIHAGLSVLEKTCTESDYLVGDEFSATDIIVGWTVNWARNGGKVSFDEFPSLSAYLGRLFAREHCTLSPPD